jgi:hypothetical protein
MTSYQRLVWTGISGVRVGRATSGRRPTDTCLSGSLGLDAQFWSNCPECAVQDTRWPGFLTSEGRGTSVDYQRCPAAMISLRDAQPFATGGARLVYWTLVHKESLVGDSCQHHNLAMWNFRNRCGPEDHQTPRGTSLPASADLNVWLPDLESRAHGSCAEVRSIRALHLNLRKRNGAALSSPRVDLQPATCPVAPTVSARIGRKVRARTMWVH